MGLLQTKERQDLKNLLADIPNAHDISNRNSLLDGQPKDIYKRVPTSINIVWDHIDSIVDALDNQDYNKPPTGSTWPVLVMLDQALFQVGENWPYRPELEALQQTLQTRANQWAGLPDIAPPLDRPSFESLIGTNDLIASARFRSLWMERERAVCRVEFPYNGNLAQGSGFLLGPSVVMTNYHVIRPIIDNEVDWQSVRLRFDYREDDNLNPIQGQTYELLGPDREWLIDSSPFSDLDMQLQPRDAQPVADELDYALLKVNGTPGNDPVDGIPGGATRKWLTPAANHEFLAGEPLLLIGHPKGNYRRFSIDRLIGIHPQKAKDPTRLTYRTDSQPGSSGSPGFTVNWELVALHHLGDKRPSPEYNEGIPFKAIMGLLTQRGKSQVLGS